MSYDVEEEFLGVYSFFVSTYARMRGKDYCRRYMSENGLSLTKGVRTRLVVLSDPKNGRTSTSNKADQDSDEVLFEEYYEQEANVPAWKTTPL